MNKVRIAVAGAGLIGHRHIEEIQKNPICELVAIVDPAPPAKFASTAHNAGVTIYASLAEMFAKDKPDGVILATPNQLHADMAIECIRAGVTTSSKTRRAHAGRRRSPVRGRRSRRGQDPGRPSPPQPDPAPGGRGRPLRRARQAGRRDRQRRLLQTRQRGLLRRAQRLASGTGRRPNPDQPDPRDRHPRAMVGEIVAVQAKCMSNATRGFKVEDTAAISLKFDNGALGSFLLSDTAGCAKSWEQTAQENLAYATYPDEDCYTIIGSRGSLAVPTMRLKYYTQDDDRSWYKPLVCETLELLRKDPLAEQIEHFGAVIRGEAEPLVTARDGLQNLRVTEAVVEAARCGGVIATV